LRNINIGQSLEFIPAAVLQLETNITRGFPSRLPESTQRHELLLSKIATVTQLSETSVHQILNFSAKVIAYYLK
jgi:hypothetical protein